MGGGFVGERHLDNGGAVLETTKAGRTAIKQPHLLDDLVPPPASRPQPPKPRQKRAEQPSPDETQPDPDSALLEKLRAWRLALAKEQKVPPYVILHNSHLSALAAHRPTTLEELSQIKGFGPKRLDQYGKALLAIIVAHLGTNAPPTVDT